MDATTVAVDLAKTVFELAIANGQWRIVSRTRLNRAPFTRFLAEIPSTHVVTEACGALLGTRCAAARPPRDAGAAGLRAAVCPTEQDGSSGCGSDPRSCPLGRGAERPSEARGAASGGRVAPRSRAVDDDADRADQHAARDPARAQLVAAGRGSGGGAGGADAPGGGRDHSAAALAHGPDRRSRGDPGARDAHHGPRARAARARGRGSRSGALADDSGDWRADRDRARGQRRARPRVPPRAAICSGSCRARTPVARVAGGAASANAGMSISDACSPMAPAPCCSPLNVGERRRSHSRVCITGH
jgi:hypothetical protein